MEQKFTTRVQKPHREPTEAELGYSNLLDEHEAIKKLNEEFSEEPSELQEKPVNDKIIGEYLIAFFGKTLLGKHVDQDSGQVFYKLRSLYEPNSRPPYDFCQTETSLKFTFRLQNATIPPEGIFLPLKESLEVQAAPPPAFFEKPVTFVSACCRFYENNSAHPMAASFNVEVTHKALSISKNPLTEIAVDMGGLRGAAVLFEPQTKKRKDQFFLHVQHVDGIRYHYTNPDFIRQTHRITGSAESGAVFGKPLQECTQAEINFASNSGSCDRGRSQSLWNGLVRIPAEVCKRANLPLYDEKKAIEAHLRIKRLVDTQGLTRGVQNEHTENTAAVDDGGEDDGGIMMMDIDDSGAGGADQITDEERKQSKFLNVDDDKKIRCWYLIPADHLLSWPLTTTLDQRKSAGIYAVQFYATAPNAGGKFLCGYLVPDSVLRGLIRSYESRWQNRVDIREDALNRTGFTVAPSNRSQGTLEGVNLEFTVHCQCIFWNQIPDGVPLAPKLHPKFPPFSNFVRTPFDDDLGQRLQALSIGSDKNDTK